MRASSGICAVIQHLSRSAAIVQSNCMASPANNAQQFDFASPLPSSDRPGGMQDGDHKLIPSNVVKSAGGLCQRERYALIGAQSKNTLPSICRPDKDPEDAKNDPEHEVRCIITDVYLTLFAEQTYRSIAIVTCYMVRILLMQQRI